MNIKIRNVEFCLDFVLCCYRSVFVCVCKSKRFVAIFTLKNVVFEGSIIVVYIYMCSNSDYNYYKFYFVPCLRFYYFFSKQNVQSFFNANKPIDSVIFDRNLLYDLSPKGKFIPFIEMRVYSFLELVLLPI